MPSPAEPEHDHEPNVVAIKRLMKERGLTREKLCQLAPVSPNTLRSVLQGKRAMQITFNKIAKALQVTPDQIINNYQPDTAPLSPARPTIEAVSYTPFSTFDETDLHALLKDIAAAIKARGRIYLIVCDNGSTYIHLSVHKVDVLLFSHSLTSRRPIVGDWYITAILAHDPLGRLPGSGNPAIRKPLHRQAPKRPKRPPT